MPMNSARPESDSPYPAARYSAPPAGRRPAVVLALLIGLLAAAVAPATAAGRGAPDTVRAAAVASAPSRAAAAPGAQTSVRAAAPAQAVFRGSHHSTSKSKTSFGSKKSKWKSKAKSGFFKAMGGFLILVLFFVLLCAGLLIWVVWRIKRRVANERHNG